MPTARQVITNALTFRLNRLSPGETLDPDTAGTCLLALNEVIDSFNGLGSFLFREVFTPGVCNGVSGTLGTTWASVHTGQEILGASISYGGADLPMAMGTMAQYQEITLKTLASIPRAIYPDGGDTVYFYPAAAGQTITLRTRQNFSSFADLDTVYSMPDGYLSALSALVAELMAPTMVGGVSPSVAAAARGARMRLGAQNAKPAILDTARRSAGNVLAGWN